MSFTGCSAPAPAASYAPAAVFAPEPNPPAPESRAEPKTSFEQLSSPPPCASAAAPAPACDSDTLRVSQDLAFNPQYALPPAAVKGELDRVANAMHDQPEWQLLRVEVYSTLDPRGNVKVSRREMDESQRRADAILGYLYRKRRVSAERLDAIGYGFVSSQATGSAGLRWRVVLRLVQRLR